MKIIHTADWHLGQSFYDYSRKDEHSRFLEWLRLTVKERHINVLLIAGDVFDNSNPSAESQKMYYSFLKDITTENPELQIIIIAGNHDSSARLEAPNPLLENFNVTVRGIVPYSFEKGIDYEHLIIPLTMGGYCLAVPYLRQSDCPPAADYSSGVKSLYTKLYEIAKDKALKHNGFAPIITMGHLQTSGSEVSENDRSERAVVGGLECISPTTFANETAYVALGHLHRGQKVAGHENVRYSGSPLKMSFAEKNNRQGVVYIEIEPETINIEHISFEDAVKMISIPKEAKPLEEVLDEIRALPSGKIGEMSPFLEVNVLIREPEPSIRYKIEEALKGKAVRLARISAKTLENKDVNRALNYEELQETNPADIAEKIFEKRYGEKKMPEKMRKLLNEVIKEVES
ncbi:MAG: exonuclease SbcCD subunit D C-terminal domain-containing protein [Tannerella sp.]|jgi:exonuclease SbcD|nr:exonuclease SbcCD subunit D C-terminal domain-containing protein [Tannerella sp.]